MGDRVWPESSTIFRMMVLSGVVRSKSIPLQAKQMKGFSEPLQTPEKHSPDQAGMNMEGLRRPQTDGHPGRVTLDCNFCITPFL